MTTDDGTQCIVQTHFIIQIVKVSIENIVPVLSWIIDLSNEHNGIVCFDLRNDPIPELDWNHLGHVATESIDSFAGPKFQNVQHLMPCIGDRIEMPCTSIQVIDSIIQLDGLVPVVSSWVGIKMVVTCDFRRKLTVFKILLLGTEMKLQTLPGDVVEVVVAVKGNRGIILFTQVFDKRLFCI